MATAYAYAPEPPTPALQVADYQPARFTADEFLRMEELGAFEGHKLELVDGELWEEPLPGMDHGELQMRLGYLLMLTVGREVYVSGEVSMRLGERRLRDPDLAIIGRSATRGRSVDPSDVTLAIEISDTTLATDLHAKAIEYADAGIADYWVVDVAGGVVHAMRLPGPDGYYERRQVRFDEPLAVPGGGEIVIAVTKV